MFFKFVVTGVSFQAAHSCGLAMGPPTPAFLRSASSAPWLRGISSGRSGLSQTEPIAFQQRVRPDPAFGTFFAGLHVELAALCEYFEFLAAMALFGRHEADGAVALLAVVPSNEALDPGSRVLDAGKAPRRPAGAVLAVPETSLGEGVVVGDTRPAEGGRDPEPLHRRLHGCAFHGAAIVRMQYQRAGDTFFRPDSALQESPRIF